MEGSRLFILSEDQALARRWVTELQARMRARKLFDRWPGAKVVVHPWGTPVAAPPHVDRLYMRGALSRGSMMQQVADEPAEAVEDRKAQLDEMLDEWSELARRALFNDRIVGGWGHPYPKIVFVGDRYNGERAERRPFSNKQGASRVLSQLLNHAGLREPDLYFVNAYDATGRTALRKEQLAWLRPREVVVMGREAYRLFNDALDVGSFVVFPHPQYLGRFEHDALPRWGAKLRALVEHAL